MTICLTGAAGFLGSRVLAELVARGHDVRCAVRSAAKADALNHATAAGHRPRVQTCVGQLDHPAFCRELVAGCDAVVHAAAPLNGSTSTLFAQGVVPTRVLAKAAADAGVRRFVLVSSLGVYGSQHLRRGAVLDERCPIDGRAHLRDPYTYSKVAQEYVCREIREARGLPLVVIRPGVLFGPGRPLLTGRIGLLLGRVLVQMGGARRVPYSFVDNCARAIARSVEADGIDGMAFNVVDDNLPSASDIVRLHQSYVSKVRRIVVPGWALQPFARTAAWCASHSGGMVPAVVTPYKASALWKPLRYSNALAKHRLGWTPQVPFLEAVRRTLGPAVTSSTPRNC